MLLAINWKLLEHRCRKYEDGLLKIETYSSHTTIYPV